MKKKSKVLASIKKPFIRNKKQKTNKQKYPDAYFAAVFINQSNYNGVKIVAEIEGLSMKAATDKLLHNSLSKYLGTALKNHNMNRQVNKLLSPGTPKIPTMKAIKVLRKWAVEAGISLYRCKKWGL